MTPPRPKTHSNLSSPRSQVSAQVLTMTLPLTVLQKISDFAGWGASGRLVACGTGSADVIELRRIRAWIRAGFHGLSIPWTSLKSIGDFAGIPGAANLSQTERGYDIMKLFRRDTAQTIIRNHFADVANSWGAIDRQAARDQRAHEHHRGRRFEEYRYREGDSDDENVAFWREWAGD
jgi:hypothetical protein